MKKAASKFIFHGLFLILIVYSGTSCKQSTDDSSLKFPLVKGWEIQSSAIVNQSGAIISTGNFKPDSWYKTTVPTTVLAALVDNKVYPDPYFGMNLRSIPGTDYGLNKNFSNISMSDVSPFRVSWWYRTQFQLPSDFDNKAIQLHFKGINYRANIWLNGKLIADTTDVAGAFRIYEYDINDYVIQGNPNYLAVEIFAPRKDDLAITWVEWNPAPPDKNMGLWHEVLITATGPVTVRFPQVVTAFDLPSLDVAHLTVNTELHNTSDQPITGTLIGEIEKVSFAMDIDLKPNESRVVTFDPQKFEQLNFKQPRIWWPIHFGEPNLYKLKIAFESSGKVSDSQTINFGIRQVTSELTEKNYLLFKINGKEILIRGGGRASDMLLRLDSARLRTEISYVKDMNLNAIRLEGKLENDYFYDLCDSQGILVMPGWCCCDLWEKWKNWDEQDYSIAAESLKDQVKRLRSHPSVFTWLYGSDFPPPADVEKMYLSVLLENNWPNPHQSSAALKPTDVTGYSGIRMEGPYFYTEPSYWLTDTVRGGAFGFNAEIGPGASIPVMESILEMIPKDSLWPISEIWHYHARGGGPAHMLDIDTKALNARYGEAKDLEDYVTKSQLQAYEGKRAMFEAYGRNKYKSTGVIQWMLNNAWPGVYWNLYDYYLRTGGSYYGTKKACEPLHIQYSYDDHSIAVVNSYLQEFKGLKASASVFNLDLSEKFSKEVTFDISPDGVERVIAIPDLQDLSKTYFIKLDLKDAEGNLRSSNFYWLSTQKEVFDWGNSYFWTTPMISYPDFTALQTIPKVELEMSSIIEEVNNQELVRVTISNPTKQLAFGVNVKITRGKGGKEIIPVLWEDNYFPLMPGEKREILGTYLGKDLKKDKPEIVLAGLNIL
jgi:exo-1,4-beta-D-glucosaminidase